MDRRLAGKIPNLFPRIPDTTLYADRARESFYIGNVYILLSALWYAGTTVMCFFRPLLVVLIARTIDPGRSGVVFTAMCIYALVATFLCFRRWGLLPALPESMDDIGRIGGYLRKSMAVLREQFAIAGEDDGEYFEAVGDLLENRLVLSMSTIRHHRTSTLHHSLVVSQTSFYLAKAFGFDAVSVARGGLLHDFFLYDWRTKDHPHHPTAHPEIALVNARAAFSLNDVEEDIIRTHMWPVTRGFYTYRESFLVSSIDKISTLWDLGPLLRGIFTGK